MRSKKVRIVLLIALLCWAHSFNTFAAAETLREGARGDSVTQLKIRLFDLGYIRSLKNASDKYTADTLDKVRRFQALNGLAQTGEADPQTMEKMHSNLAVKAPLPEDRPTYNIEPDRVPDIIPEDMPVTDDSGYLAQGSSPYVYKNRQAGYWHYLSDRMRVVITRFYQAEGQIEWFEAHITYRDSGCILYTSPSPRD